MTTLLTIPITKSILIQFSFKSLNITKSQFNQPHVGYVKNSTENCKFSSVIRLSLRPFQDTGEKFKLWIVIKMEFHYFSACSISESRSTQSYLVDTLLQKNIININCINLLKKMCSVATIFWVLWEALKDTTIINIVVNYLTVNRSVICK